MKRFFLILLCVLLPISVIIFLVFCLESSYNHDLKAIDENPSYTVGVVIEKRYYKGRGIKYQYVIDNKKYVNSRGRMPIEIFEGIKIGDSIDVKYEKNNPSNSVIF